MLRHLKCNPLRFADWRNSGAETRVRKSVNPVQLAIDLAAELERVQARAKFQERGESSANRSLVGFPSRQPIQGCARKVVASAQLRAHAHFLDQLRRRLKRSEEHTSELQSL